MEYTQHLHTILKYASQEAQRLGNEQVQPEHLLLAILRVEECKAYQMLMQAGVSMQDLKQAVDKQVAQPNAIVTTIVFSRTSERILRLTSIEADHYNAEALGSEHLLMAIMRERINLPAMYLEQAYQLTYETLEALLPKPKTSTDTVEAYDTEDGIPIPAFIHPQKEKTKKGETPTLDKYARDLTLQAKEGELDPVVGRKEEMERVAHILLRRKKNNPVLIGEPGVGKSAIVEGIAQLIATEKLPQMQGKRILSLNIAAMVAGTSYRGQFEQRMQNLLTELREHPEIILFIDEIHTIIGAGNAQGSLDAANILKPALARGEIQCIGATTTDEYRKSIEKDGALERRFQKVTIRPTTATETYAILRQLSPRYEAFHHVTYTEEALHACVNLSERYLTERAMPDKAIDAMDEAGARHHHTTITTEDIATVISRMSGIPIQRVASHEHEQLLHMETQLLARVIGQDEAVHKVVAAIRRARLGLHDPNRPLGTFFFLGQTGVGKTYLAQCLAEQLFGTKNALIRFDMSEYTEKHTTSLLVGAPPGYLAHEDGGKLTEAVRRHPYSVVLFDEIEKAHPDIFNIFLQMLDEGRLTDRQGRQVDFRHTVIILTSNIGTRQLHEFGAGVGFQSGELSEQMANGTLLKALRKTFPPEFVNRIDDVVTFRALSRETIAHIVGIEIQHLQNRLREAGHTLMVSPEARQQLLDLAYNPQNGARPVKRVIQQYLEDPLTEKLLRHPQQKSLRISKIENEKQ